MNQKLLRYHEKIRCFNNLLRAHIQTTPCVTCSSCGDCRGPCGWLCHHLTRHGPFTHSPSCLPQAAHPHDILYAAHTCANSLATGQLFHAWDAENSQEGLPSSSGSIIISQAISYILNLTQSITVKALGIHQVYCVPCPQWICSLVGAQTKYGVRIVWRLHYNLSYRPIECLLHIHMTTSDSHQRYSTISLSQNLK